MVQLLDASGKVAGGIRLEVRGAGVRPGRSAGLRILKWQDGRPVAKITAITLEGLDQADKTITQPSFYAGGGVATVRANNFSFAQGCRQSGHDGALNTMLQHGVGRC